MDDYYLKQYETDIKEYEEEIQDYFEKIEEIQGKIKIREKWCNDLKIQLCLKNNKEADYICQ